MTRNPGESTDVGTSIEVFYGDEYQEIVVGATYHVLEPATDGYFDHASGVAEPPSGPTLDRIDDYWIRRVHPEHGDTRGMSGFSLRTMLGQDWMREIDEELEEKAVEALK